MSNHSAFKFKRFSICDDQSALKLGTDAVLLGAWTNIKKADSILDIGTGCGIIALMLAQRSDGTIDAIDIHQPSVEQAKGNFENSPWSNQLNSIHSSIQDYSKSSEKKYDQIVCNPPFFENDLKSPKELNNLSKHNDQLPYDELILALNSLLKPCGKFSMILPLSNSVQFEYRAKFKKLHCRRETIVFPKQDKKPNRILLEFGKEKIAEKESSQLTIRNIDGSYTQEYIELTKDFYLNF